MPRRLQRAAVALFCVAIFSSAFLLFAVQPMVGKRVLPWFGGVPSVWTLCLAFYQTTLLAGYAYAHALASWVRPPLQPWIHAALFALAWSLLPVLPGEVWKPEGGGDASARILAMLAANVALPFALLAATGPLVQAWFARGFPGRSPYPLYAVSNLGSLLALLSYPTLVEPNLPVSLQSRAWSWTFGISGLLIASCAAWATRAGSAPRPSRWAGPALSERPGASRIALWILLPAAAVALFMGVTNELSLDIASVPFLWVLPLSIYLLTLILAFASERAYRRGPMLGLAAVLLAALVLARLRLLPDSAGSLLTSIAGQIVLYAAMLFAGCLIAHGELYRLRPAADRLTAYYLAVAGGGALGGLLVALVAPRVFTGYHELPLAVGLTGVLALLCWWLEVARTRRPRWALVVAFWMWATLGFAYALPPPTTAEHTRLVERNFFGVLRVGDRLEPDTSREIRVLRNGTTRHGVQYRGASERSTPASYYCPSTGIAIAVAARAERGPMQIGVIGLGVGTLAAYGRERDRVVFYEIDPDVVRIARDTGEFTYLEDSDAEIEVVMGDARLALESEPPREFDLLAVDAFNSDSVPTHLLTREAFAVYARHLAEHGMLAIHASARHFDLSPLVIRLGSSTGMAGVAIRNHTNHQLRCDASTWVLLSSNPLQIRDLESRVQHWVRDHGSDNVVAQRLGPEVLAGVPLWTDDYSDVFGLLRFRSRLTHGP